MSSRIAVRTELVQEFLVDGIVRAAGERFAAEVPAEAATALASAADERLARLGYHCRAVETERFEPARTRMPWLESALREAHVETGLSWAEAAAGVSADLAARQPEGKPDPTDPDAATWRVPGPGGHVRHLVALALAGDKPESRRAWLHGFFVRCCEEALPPA